MCSAWTRTGPHNASLSVTGRASISPMHGHDQAEENGGRAERCRLLQCRNARGRPEGCGLAGQVRVCSPGLRRSSAICCASKRGIMERSLGDHSVSSNLRPRDEDGRCSASQGEKAHLLRPRGPTEEPQRLVGRSSSHCTEHGAWALARRARIFHHTRNDPAAAPISRVPL